MCLVAPSSSRRSDDDRSRFSQIESRLLEIQSTKKALCGIDSCETQTPITTHHLTNTTTIAMATFLSSSSSSSLTNPKKALHLHTKKTRENGVSTVGCDDVMQLGGG